MAFTPVLIGGLVAASAAMQTISSFVEAQEEANRLEFESQVDRRNAKLARSAAASDAADERLEHRRRLGQIRAAYAENGVGGTGTSLDVLEDFTTEGEFDIAKIKYNGEVKAIGLEDSADQKASAARGTRGRAGFGLAAGLLGSGVSGAGAALRVS